MSEPRERETEIRVGDRIERRDGGDFGIVVWIGKSKRWPWTSYSVRWLPQDALTHSVHRGYRREELIFSRRSPQGGRKETE